MSKSELGLTYLNGLTPWNGRGGFALEAISKVLLRLDKPQDAYPTIHIAGTNGKGSVSSSIASILGQAGYKVGLNTSPHLQALNERIVIDGSAIDSTSLGEFAYDIRTAAAKDLSELSFHEAITAISFLAIREMGMEWGVFEVGLGGRLDSSNVISRPAATAIVTIDFDHQQLLGNTLGEIATEKAGIVKAGSPLITGFLQPEAEKAIAKRAIGIERFRFGHEFGCRRVGGEDTNRFVYWGKNSRFGSDGEFEFTSPLPGEHQGHNLAVAAAIASCIGISQPNIINGLQKVYWPARLETSDVQGVKMVMDCAHNPAGIRAFRDFLVKSGVGGIDLTFGVLDTKNWQEMVHILAPYVTHWRLISPDSERALPLELVERELEISRNEIRISRYDRDYEGLVKDLLDSGETTKFITGSMYMVGKLRDMLGMSVKPLWERVS